jgi:mono/diheme cytochrome c family protein
MTCDIGAAGRAWQGAVGMNAVALVAVVLAITSGEARAATALAPEVQRYFAQHCMECHDADSRRGGLDLTSLIPNYGDRDTFATWVKVYDKVQSSEMPPRDEPRPPASATKEVTAHLFAAMAQADRARWVAEGRATRRRLNRHEYEDTLRDLLSLPHLQVKQFLPEDGEADRFNKSGEALDVSHVNLSRYLSAADHAVRQALAPPEKPAAKTERFYARDQRAFIGGFFQGPALRQTFPVLGWKGQPELMVRRAPNLTVGPSNPKVREQEAIAIATSTYEPTEIRFSSFRAPVSGMYKLRFSTYTLWLGNKSEKKYWEPDHTKISRGRRDEPIVVYSDAPPHDLRRLGGFDSEPTPGVDEITAWLNAGETVRPDAARLVRSRPHDFKNPLAEKDGMPAVAFRWMEAEGPIVDAWPPRGHTLLFGHLPVVAETPPPVVAQEEAAPQGEGEQGGQKRKDAGKDVGKDVGKDTQDPEQARRHRRREPPVPPPVRVRVLSVNPVGDAQALLAGFLARAYRRPVEASEGARFLNVFRHAMKSGYTFTEAMIAMYTAVLSSPGFLYLDESPGRLGDMALAARLSYFLLNSAPDKELQTLARGGVLSAPAVLRQQTERLLQDPRSRRFVDNFLDYWLDLRRMGAAAPDAVLYPDYQLDDFLVESMIEESQLFFAALIEDDLGVANLVASRFAMLNERLATHYGIPKVTGVALRRVPLPASSVRGGFLTQASVLKVTANGTTTSPVLRGAWIMERILGKRPPPPPPDIPAVEPDTTGATTIRQQLAKHSVNGTCAGCHKYIDPPGFALESFDPMGGWRERYRALGGAEKVKGFGHDGMVFAFSLGLAVEPHGEMADGRAFRDVHAFKRLLAADSAQLARNMVGQLATYATGAPVRFSDRTTVDAILNKSRRGGHGVRTLIHELVQSEMFQCK